MIFFLTTITPSSNVEVRINDLKRDLFSDGLLIPLPFTVLPVEISLEKPIRPTRKEVAAKCPPLLIPRILTVDKGQLILTIRDEITCETGRKLKDSITIIPGAIFLGPLAKESMPRARLENQEIPSFKNYSLTCYEINCEDPESWWKNMSWVKLWDVKKSKTPHDLVS